MQEKISWGRVLRHRKGILAVAVLVLGVAIFLVLSTHESRQATKNAQASLASSVTTSSSSAQSDLPAGVKASDWDLVLVNRDHITSEMNPELTEIDGISVDSRIAQNVRDFLAAAQAIAPEEHLISGYRSVAYQEELFNSYVAQEMAADPSLTQAQAEEKVKTYSQPAGASEHMTGLAIDMSTVNSLNESDPNVVERLKAIAADYGFVLRFASDKSSSTGVGYEDWHWRYVGVANAKYMTQHNLSLEEYVALLQKEGRQ
ncbi:D-alanyl-D-alanine carboxypeptidase family protein [Streptococcus sp. DD12]|uniref:D-alanyl-D-alanine carboxypeptidase family protein n=1 Tax=Streptococcus sp. DD12 TaxID=1777880 RepID=UPI00079A5C6E|nr:D-alanyl-D-alanine carboxypeptidase family protein [Streptococcus sp. DD12]KXT75727.1 D-alanyl-D-alanine carboxypeptidase [Streptococcus sp. DD12]